MKDFSFPGPAEAGLIEGIARVVAVSGVDVVLEAESRSVCGSCSVSNTCGMSSLSRYMGRRPVRFRIDNDFHGQVGERVVIGIDQGALLKASLIAYMIPMVGLIGGALAAVALGAGDGLTAVTAISGLVLGFLAVRRFGPGGLNEGRLKPVFLRRAGASGSGRLVCAPGS